MFRLEYCHLFIKLITAIFLFDSSTNKKENVMLLKHFSMILILMAFFSPLVHAQLFTPIPENTQIVFSSRRDSTFCNVPGVQIYSNELYAMDSTGGNLTRITHDHYFHNHFAVSPDRKKIVAVRILKDTDGDNSLRFLDWKSVWILDLKNQIQWRVDRGFDAGWGGVDWDPDNNHIYTSLVDHTNNNEVNIFKINIYDSTKTNITGSIDNALGITHGKFVSDVSVSHDGEWIVFALKKRESVPPYELVKKSMIVKCRSNGENAQYITYGGNLPPQQFGAFSIGDYDPEFNPDNQWVVFERVTLVNLNWGTSPESGRGLGSGVIMKMKVDRSDSLIFTPSDSTGTYGLPDWSPDGGKIIVSEWNENQFFIGTGIMNANGDGTDYARILPGPWEVYGRWMFPPGQTVIGDFKDGKTPGEFELFQNYPNPFNPSTIILYSVPNTDFVTLKIYDMLGRKIQTLVSDLHQAGIYSVKFETRNLPGGIYFYRLQIGINFMETKKMLVIH